MIMKLDRTHSTLLDTLLLCAPRAAFTFTFTFECCLDFVAKVAETGSHFCQTALLPRLLPTFFAHFHQLINRTRPHANRSKLEQKPSACNSLGLNSSFNWNIVIMRVVWAKFEYLRARLKVTRGHHLKVGLGNNIDLLNFVTTQGSTFPLYRLLAILFKLHFKPPSFVNWCPNNLKHWLRLHLAHIWRRRSSQQTSVHLTNDFFPLRD